MKRWTISDPMPPPPRASPWFVSTSHDATA
jgi:hypothetical protein